MHENECDLVWLQMYDALEASAMLYIYHWFTNIILEYHNRDKLANKQINSYVSAKRRHSFFLKGIILLFPDSMFITGNIIISFDNILQFSTNLDDIFFRLY